MGYNLGSHLVISSADYNLHVFNEVLVLPDMLLTLQHPRRSQYAPIRTMICDLPDRQIRQTFKLNA
jgi:hypothetical protein